MGDARVDREAGLLLATPATMDALAGLGDASPQLRARLELSGWLAGGVPPADLEPLVTVWASARARITVSVRVAGHTTTITGLADGELAVLLVPIEHDRELRQVTACPVETLPRWTAIVTRLGPRPAHGADVDLVPLSWPAVKHCLGDPQHSPLRRDAHRHALMLAPESAVDAVFSPDARRITVTVTGTTADAVESIDVVDAGDRGLWLVAALPPDGTSAAAIPFSVRGVWQLLGRTLQTPARLAADAAA